MIKNPLESKKSKSHTWEPLTHSSARYPLETTSRRTTVTSSLKWNIHGPGGKYRMVVTRQSLRNAIPTFSTSRLQDIYERRRARFLFHLGYLLRDQAYLLFIELLSYDKLCIFWQKFFSPLFSLHVFLRLFPSHTFSCFCLILSSSCRIVLSFGFLFLNFWIVFYHPFFSVLMPLHL
jgi:hypothetical protein